MVDSCQWRTVQLKLSKSRQWRFVRAKVDACQRQVVKASVARSDRYRYARMRWLKHCSIDYRERDYQAYLYGLTVALLRRGQHYARGNTMYESTPRPRRRRA